MMTPVKKMRAISLVIHIVTLFLMLVVLKWNIYAVVLSKIIFSGAICILNAKALRDRIGYVQEKRNILNPDTCFPDHGCDRNCDSSDLRIIRRSVYRNNHCTSGSSCSIWSIYRCTWRDYGRRITWHAKRSSPCDNMPETTFDKRGIQVV